MVKRLAKPHFGVGLGSAPHPDLSVNIVEAELLRLIPGHAMGGNEARELVNRCRELAKSVSVWKPDLSVAVADQKKELELVESRAHALLLALRAMQPGTLSTLSSYVTHMGLTTALRLTPSEIRGAPQTQDAALLDSVWDLVENLEIGARLTASHCKPRRGRKFTAREHVKALIVSVAYEVQVLSGKRPPYSKDTWFPEFMNAFGKMVKIPCGRAAVERVLFAVESIEIA